jgi:hypothetical protein
MKKWIFLLSILMASCTQTNRVIDELYIDYFPTSIGMKWVYRTPDSLLVVREVLQDSEVSPSLNLVQVEMMGEMEQYKKSPDLVSVIYEYSKFINGNEVIFEKSDLPLFYQPVLKDEFFADTLSRAVILGDTFRYTRLFTSQITKGKGERKNLLFTINVALRKGGVEEKQSIYCFYELAPDTGPVYIKKIYNGDTLELHLEQFFK